MTEEENLEQKAKEHVEAVNMKFPTYDTVMNADQSGFLYEFTSTRTLSTVGEKITRVVAECLNKTTHSYTIMPIITAAGRLLSPLFICLQEVTGDEFGPFVKEAVERSKQLRCHRPYQQE